MSSPSSALWAAASENMSGKMRAPRCSNGTRSAHSPRLPPTIDGDADSSSPWRPSNGCGRKREVQSMTFLSMPGIDMLYSGDAMMKASLASRRRCSSWAPGGMPSAVSTSPS
jgi:hypothetical protein